MKVLQNLLFICVSILQVSGCTSSNVIPTGPDTYMVSASGAGFATAGVREIVYQKANDFCASKGLVMVPVSFKAREGQLGRNPPSADLIFRALKPGAPAIERPDITDANENIAVAQNIKISVKGEEKPETKSDTYNDLLKLDDLRRRGILSEVEFEQEKTKLLQSK
ncbi:SHOCT domain-containing protein [Cellvibrio sp. KY-YJ-3]|uniref:SHOCT domain-containing protein n=1 Tax=Cellvibrio sp. KY-YJ-3 TaxID=454662 RepID=UPI001CDA25D7|nr:SHOCT domain-containing protein [Cellvibrio sp. KY-YJ-3]